MLALLFEVEGFFCALPCAKVVEVLPWMPLHPVLDRGAEVRGVLVYRGAMVGIADARRLIHGTPSRSRLSTRIVIFDDEGRHGGIICEGTRGVHTLGFVPTLGSAPALGPMFSEIMQADTKLVHVVALDALLGRMGNTQQVSHGAQTST